MTTPTTSSTYTDAAPAAVLEQVAATLRDHNFAAEIVDDAAAARARVSELITEGATVFTVASETLRLSGIEADLNESGRYDSVKARSVTMDRATQMADIWRLIACPDVIVGSVSAITQDGALIAASASGSQLAGYSGGAQQVILVVGAQKVVPDLSAALRRVEEHCVPLENERALKVYGVPSALNRVLILNAEPHPGRATVLLVREAIGF
jgi:acyl-CoA hydrolase